VTATRQFLTYSHILGDDLGKNREMRKIPAQFTKKGFEYRLVSRNGDIAIYEQSSDTQKWYEVVVIKKIKETEFNMDGRLVVSPPREKYPSDNEWGTLGWTFHTLPDAQVKAEEVKMSRLINRSHFKSPQIPDGYQD